MDLRAPAVALIVLVLAACTATPAPTGTPTVAPTGTPPPTAPPTATLAPTLPPAPTPAPTPTLAPTPTAVPTATPTAEPTATPTVAPTPVPTWIGPELVVPGSFAETDIAVDDSGNAHIAAAGSGADNKGIWYLTSASGAWTKHRVSTPPPVEGYEGYQYDGEPSIALDNDGSIWIAFTRWACNECAPNPSDGIFVVNNAGGAWSEPVQLAGEQANSPSLMVGGGWIDLAYAEGMLPGRRSYPIWRGYGDGADWSVERVARNGSSPTLALNPHGGMNILFAASDIRFGYVITGTLVLTDRLPGSANGFNPILFEDLAKDPVTGENYIGVAWTSLVADQQHFNVSYSTLVAAAWSDPITAIGDAEATGIGEYDGVVHMIAADLGDNWGRLLYASNASGAFVTSSLHGRGGDRSALAVDLGGRPHVVFAVDEPRGQRGIWYAIGPNG